MKTLQLTILILISTIHCYAQSVTLNGITPLISTRQDVEKILGKPVEDDTYSAVYRTKDEIILVGYKVEETRKIKNCLWNVPVNTVLGFEIRPLKTIFLNEIKLDITKFERKFKRGYQVYTNANEGWEVFTIVRDEAKEEISYFSRIPTLSQIREKCKTSKN